MVMLSRSVASACSFSRCVCAGVHSEYYICGCVCVYIYRERERERETRIPVYAQVFTESIINISIYICTEYYIYVCIYMYRVLHICV